MTDDRRLPERLAPPTPEERAEQIAEQYLRHLHARHELETAHPEVADLLHEELCLAEVMAGAVRPADTPGP